MILKMLRARKRLAKMALGGAFAAGAVAGGTAAAVAVTGVAVTGAVGVAGVCALKRAKDRREAAAST
ncbi:hypothetical protein EJV46_03340 [Roseococcus sp. SYP-B2431]|uniref:hypothetical protein n=1 Tax=Roseococcus sp. SYP-B2431 TaxID=2496640 RepID=UPI0010391AC3|nr:hypothetical protein [Roseococcus sp. SYP-B2431]TCH99721.1 hypothetical protein EJV46_03340 [Roseococcus sp. SYP-B2431]